VTHSEYAIDEVRGTERPNVRAIQAVPLEPVRARDKNGAAVFPHQPRLPILQCTETSKNYPPTERAATTSTLQTFVFLIHKWHSLTGPFVRCDTSSSSVYFAFTCARVGSHSPTDVDSWHVIYLWDVATRKSETSEPQSESFQKIAGGRFLNYQKNSLTERAERAATIPGYTRDDCVLVHKWHSLTVLFVRCDTPSPSLYFTFTSAREGSHPN